MSAKSASMAIVWALSLGILSLVLSFGIGVGGSVGKAFAIIGAFFGFASVSLSVVGQVKSGGIFKPVSIAGTAMGVTGAYLSVTSG